MKIIDSDEFLKRLKNNQWFMSGNGVENNHFQAAYHIIDSMPSPWKSFDSFKWENQKEIVVEFPDKTREACICQQDNKGFQYIEMDEGFIDTKNKIFVHGVGDDSPLNDYLWMPIP